ncbi:chlorophyll synthase ChlG [Rhabdaerophilum sp. SD176]|uniref:chlorophyll synthase ChlG n=1 Tax=Rhabdaerophilum sp. SD176 TaxID=2983548 RepID=UPI0024DF7278|nr:chlorophyll synthase ChlG [Rhabdaerophilum sp. SD176]
MNRPALSAMVELLKPITWFPPMWAYACGIASVGIAGAGGWMAAAAGVLLAGPLVCGTSQVVNDWFDRHVDAINEPNRPIPSGRVPGRWGLGFAIVWTAVSALVAALLGPWVLAATVLGLALAWAYSAPPFRLKRNGWVGNAAVGLCYEGLPWFTAAAAILGTFPDSRLVWIALLYSLGAHGIMTLNDFKSIEGDRQMGLRSVPAQLGAERAALLACWVMALPQLVVILLLWLWNAPVHAGLVAGILLAQIALMKRLLSDPRGRAPWYNATGITLYVSGMMVSAFALRMLASGGTP